jgi:hypothetical protein
VTIVPDDGSTSSSPDDFEGKLVIMFDAIASVHVGDTARHGHG